nr:PREDICTED: MFP1 attachment factor 1-like isoform X2 [Musa acuminata subsp. malaccensis]
MAEDSEATKHGSGEAPAKGSNEAEASATPPPPPASRLPSVSLNIWPPSQRTREAVIQHLIETLTSPSLLSKRYGVLSLDEASATGRLIEEEAFAAAATAAAADGAHATSVDEEVEILQIYSKGISKRVIETVKKRGSSVDGAAKVTPTPADSDAPATAAGEEASSLESETPQA